MPNKYCSKCGFGNSYDFFAPTTCGKCKSSFGAIVSQAPAKIPSRKKFNIEPDEPTESYDLDSLSNIQITVAGNRPERVKIDNIIATADENSIVIPEREKYAGSVEDFMREFSARSQRRDISLPEADSE